MPIHEKVAWIIRSSREQHGYSQEYMADMLHIVQSTYAAIESGKTALTLDRLIQIAAILKINLCEVFQQCMQNNELQCVKFNHQVLMPESKELYEKMVMELKEEIFFLRGMMREREMRESE
jgi:transcriptional regulator with XRE-family HTH domain